MKDLIYTIDEELIQSMATANLGRELTTIELERMPSALADAWFIPMMGAIIEAVEDAMNNEDGRWDSYDKEMTTYPLDV